MKVSKLIPYLLVLLLAVSILGVLSYDGVDAAPAPTRTPVAVEGTATPVHIHLEWGQEFHILCSQDSLDPSSGIISMESTGSDQWNGNCRPPNTP